MSQVDADTQAEWYRLTVDTTLDRLDTDRQGLTGQQARERAARYGPTASGATRESAPGACCWTSSPAR